MRQHLLRWYRANRRELPWRRTRDPYAIWVSEIMLQQTQVATVLPYYERFLERFPNSESLAGASEDEVLSVWSGLGYYRRARSLHRGARTIQERHAGRLPADPAELRHLPGIGRYTAGAISSIAFGLAEPVLDGNVRRVLARVFGVRGSRSGPAGEERRLWTIAGELVRCSNPGDLNQALMELGALVCSPREPACEDCPLAPDCRAHAEGRPEAYPTPRPAARVTSVRVAVALVRRAGRVLLERPGDDSPFRGTWDLPAREIQGEANARARLECAITARHDLHLRVGPLIARAKHDIMQRRLGLEIHDCRLYRGRVAGRGNLRWADPRALAAVPVSGATAKVLRAVQSEPLPGRHALIR
jgi:A/G-specific adenine glycosylase